MTRRSPRSAKAKGSPTKADLLARVAALEKRLRAVARALARKDEETQALARELTETREHQMAASEILRVISSSPTDLQSVMDTVALSAARLCSANDAQIFRLEGDTLRRVAQFGSLLTLDVVPLTRAWIASRAVIDRQIIHVLDRAAEVQIEFPEGRDIQQRVGHRTTLAIPLLCEETVIGSIFIARTEVRPFSDSQIALLQTFADQAAIAIENVRLFTELAARNQDLTEALNTQTATSEILRVISRSQTDAQPVFDTIVRNAVQLCGAIYGTVDRFDGEQIHFVAHHNFPPEQLDEWRRMYPRTLSGGGTPDFVAWVRRTGHVYRIADVHAELDTGVGPEVRASWQARGVRSLLVVPMLRQHEVIGLINVTHREVGAFTDAHVELLQTFADQAVIAIENVRLFTELEARNRDLTEALEQQTATGEILRVISSSPTDTQPVFEAIARNAARLCGATRGSVVLLSGDRLHFVAWHNFPATTERDIHVSDAPHATRVIREGSVFHISDVENDPRVTPESLRRLRLIETRAYLNVPMRRKDVPIGSIAVYRNDPGSFSDKHVELLQTFADQAVIAIENVRLFTELQARTGQLTRSVNELTALGEVSRVLSSTLDLETVLETIVTRANQLTGTAGCTIWEYDEPREEFRLRVSHYADAADAAVLQALGRVTVMRKGQGVTTRVVERREPVQIDDITVEGAYESPIRRPLIEAGHRALLGVPLLSEDAVIGVLAVTRKTPGLFEPETVRLLTTFATQSALAIQNARLFLEIKDKSRQLEVASQHKSEFLANMSHELRTPLNAIIGFSEVLAEGMFGEINDKQAEYLRDILESGRHLLSLINDILDLSKIEAGRMELELEDFDLSGAIDNALTLVRERAGRRGIALGRAIDERVGAIRADERKVKQVLLNLLSNSIKFTPEGGRVDVRAAIYDSMVEVSVADTGVGIAPEDQGAVFEEFRQVGTAAKKVEGTGLGLALSRRFIELHGGRIWVKSEVGVGSTFTFTLPLSR